MPSRKGQTLKDDYPHLRSAYHPDNDRDFDSLAASSSYVAKWICRQKNHEHVFQMTVSSKTRGKNEACPFCSHRRVCHKCNCLRTVNPRLALYFNTEKNGIDPCNVICGGTTLYWFKCIEEYCQHEWQNYLDVARRSIYICTECAKTKRGLSRRKYTIEDLLDLLKERKLQLNEEITTFTVDDKLEYRCLVCDHVGSTTFYHLKTRGQGCGGKCAQQKRLDSILEHYGHELAELSGYKCPLSIPSIKQKLMQTNLQNYGREWAIASDIVQDKIRRVIMDRFGVDNVFKLEYFQLKAQDTRFEKYGTIHIGAAHEVRDKINSTNVAKYGVEYPLQSIVLQQKARKTVFDRYGVDHPMKIPSIVEKSSFNSFYRKPFLMPSGETRWVQGYEPLYLEYCLQSGYPEDNIVTGAIKVPRFNYQFDGKEHTYYPDVYHPDQNVIVEVKSTWTMQKDSEQNIAKWEAVIDAGYGFLLKVYDDKRKDVSDRYDYVYTMIDASQRVQL